MSVTPVDSSLLRALLETSSALSATLELDNLLDLISDSACRIFRSGAASILLIDTETNQLFFKTATGEKREELKSIRLKMGEGIAGWVAEHGRPMVVNNVHVETKFAREVSETIDYETRSLLAVPLKTGTGRIIGVIEVLNRLGGAYTDDDVEGLQLLANHVSTSLENARYHRDSEAERRGLREIIEERYTAIGDSPSFVEIMKIVRKVARTKSTVLLRGESGTGKEVMARAIHRESTRAHRPLIAVNCAALTDSLLESELFGYEKGAFTGADKTKKGKFEQADGSTIFLDEIGTMNHAVQAKVLRALQEKAIDRVGGSRTISVDVRIVAATNADLEQAIRDGRFREDLYYRLNVISIKLPSLRERKEDIPVLTDFFINRYNRETSKSIQGISPRALQVLMAYNFPGNVRELENMIERAVVLEDEPLIQPERLPIGPGAVASAASTAPVAHGGDGEQTLDQVEEAYIRRVFAQVGGKKVDACRVLGISRPTLDRKLEKYKIEDAGE